MSKHVMPATGPATGKGVEDDAAAALFHQLRTQNRLLKLVLGGVLTVGGALALMGARTPPSRATFDEINVARINIVGADGGRSMVIAARGLLPEPVVDGKEIKSGRGPMPGMLFYNGVGDEVGGLIYDGKLDAKGKPSAGVHLSMDRFGGDQQLAVHHYEVNGHMETGLSVYDRGLHQDYDALYQQYQAAPAGPEKQALRQKWKDAGGEQTQRLFVGRTRGDSSALILADAAGRPRIMMTVSPGGEPALAFMDDKGNVIQSLPQAATAKQ
jgi:hypothetical protein